MYRSFWKNQFRQIKKEGWSAIWRKSKRLPFLITRPFQVIITIPLVLITRLIRPLILVRFGFLPERRIGHFSGNIELYLCERDEGINVPNRPYIDIFCLKYKELCNNQLAVMWRRILHVWPWWIVSGVIQINRIIRRMANQGIDIQINNDVKSYLVKNGYNPEYGARPVQRIIRKEMLAGLSKYLLQNSEIKHVKLTMRQDRLILIHMNSIKRQRSDYSYSNKERGLIN